MTCTRGENVRKSRGMNMLLDVDMPERVPVERVVARIPVSLCRDFKIWTDRNGVTLTTAIGQMIKAYVEECKSAGKPKQIRIPYK